MSCGYLAIVVLVGCIGGSGTENGLSANRAVAVIETTWGRRGLEDGRFQKPRALVIDNQDHLYIVDMTARIQVFDRDGKFIRSWTTPVWEKGRPTGLSIDQHGNLLVADTHYHRILTYSPDGALLQDRTLGGTYGSAPGEFGLVTDAVEDREGNLYTSEYGEFDRIQKFNSDRRFVTQWGGHGSEPSQFLRPQSLALDEDGHLWVSDACNHRIQVFDVSTGSPKLLQCWGKQGRAAGELRYPYGLRLAAPDLVIVSEFGNHRIQVFDRKGNSLAVWGISGRGVGMLNAPWAVDVDSQGSVHILDTLNHRVQRIRLKGISPRRTL